MLFKPLSSILMLAAISSLSACKVTDVSDEEQSASLAPHSEHQIRGAAVEHYFNGRTAILIGAESLEANGETGETSSADSATRDVSFAVKFDPSERLAFGTAVSIDSRGYFLTAGHCFDKGEVHAMYTNAQKETVIQKVRPIWVKVSTLPEIDFALFHVEGEPFGTFGLADSFEIGDTVFSAGTTLKVNKDEDPPYQTSIDSFAGELKKAREISFKKTPFELIWHRSPVRNGNSGGPLVNKEGDLIGINYAGSNPIQRAAGAEITPMAYAIRPDGDWIQDLIEKDWAKREDN